jgi:hypothetical protein
LTHAATQIGQLKTVAKKYQNQGAAFSVKAQKACEIIWFFVARRRLSSLADSKSVWISCTDAKLHLYKSLTCVQKVNRTRAE